MLWIRNLDWISKFLPKVPRSVGKVDRARAICVLRPGGLGDLVLLTRACLSLGIDLRSIQWIVEKRNAIWLEYLDVPYFRYDDLKFFLKVLAGKYTFEKVFVSEQTFGLASLFAVRLSAKSGKIIGFESNIRSDLFDLRLSYPGLEEHELTAFTRLLNSIAKSFGNIYSSERQKSNQHYLVIVLGGLQSEDKQLSVEQWTRLIDQYLNQVEGIVLVGSPRDRQFSLQVQKTATAKFKNLVGQIPFREVVELIRGAERVVGVDSGLIHVADFFSIPTDVLFLKGREKKWGPLTEGSKILDPIILRENGFK